MKQNVVDEVKNAQFPFKRVCLSNANLDDFRDDRHVLAPARDPILARCDGVDRGLHLHQHFAEFNRIVSADAVLAADKRGNSKFHICAGCCVLGRLLWLWCAWNMFLF